VELLRTPQAARLGVDLIVAKTANDGMHGKSSWDDEKRLISPRKLLAKKPWKNLGDQKWGDYPRKMVVEPRKMVI